MFHDGYAPWMGTLDWLNKCITSRLISIDGYNVYRTAQPKKGGGTAIFVKSKFHVNVLFWVSESAIWPFGPRGLQTFAHHSWFCYRTPSGVSDAVHSSTKLLSDLKVNKILLMWDLNCNWLHPVWNEFKAAVTRWYWPRFKCLVILQMFHINTRLHQFLQMTIE